MDLDCLLSQIIQFEDFHTTLAFPVLAAHRDVYPWCAFTSLTFF